MKKKDYNNRSIDQIRTGAKLLPSLMETQLNEQLSDFELGRHLGEGSYSTVRSFLFFFDEKLLWLELDSVHF